MGTTLESIIVDVLVRDKGLKELGQKFNVLKLNLNKATDASFLINNQMNGFWKTLRMAFPDWQKFNKQGGVMQTKMGRIANSTRLLTHGLRGFRMEMLSVMFFGMGMQRFFGGLLGPALEAVGVFDIWKDTLTVLFMPVALELLEKVLLPLMNWFLSLPVPAQKAIGIVALLGFGLGTVLTNVSLLTLGIGGLISAIAKITSKNVVIGADTTAAKSKIGGFGGILTGMKGVVGTIAGLVSAGLLINTLFEFGTAEGVGAKLKVILDGISQQLFVWGLVAAVGGNFWILGIAVAFTVIKEGVEMVMGVISDIKNAATFKVDLPKTPYFAPPGTFEPPHPIPGGIQPSELIKAGITPLPIPSVDDFVMSGGRITEIDPNDTVYGTKNEGGFGNVTFAPTIHMNVSSMLDIDRLKSALTSDWRSELERITRRT